MGKIVLNEELFGIGVEANPTLVGTEENLTSIQIGDTKYKITASGSGHVDIFSAVQIAWTDGVTVLTNSASGQVGEVTCLETSTQFEGFNIAMPNLEVNANYTLKFNFQFTDADWFSGGQYMCGVKIYDTNYYAYSNYTDWTNNLDRDLLEHSHTINFTATASTMYIAINLCGLLDGRNNYFTMSDIHVDVAA